MMISREEMVQRIKDCGQSLIDNAENIVNNYKYKTDLTITCSIEILNERDPSIVVESEFVPEKYIERASRS